MRGPDPTLGPDRGSRPTHEDPDGYKRRLDDAVEDRYLVQAAKSALRWLPLDTKAEAKIILLIRTGMFSAAEAERAVDLITKESTECLKP